MMGFEPSGWLDRSSCRIPMRRTGPEYFQPSAGLIQQASLPITGIVPTCHCSRLPRQNLENVRDSAHKISTMQDHPFGLAMQCTSGYAKYDAIMLWLREELL